jgi:spermidine synthase
MAAAVFFLWHEGKIRVSRSFLRRAVPLAAAGGLLVVLNWNLNPVYVKGAVENRQGILYEKWNSFSRVVVEKPRMAPPQYWGKSPLSPMTPILQYFMNIDGLAGTTLRRFHSPADIAHLAFDVANIGYFIRPRGGALIIGAGGGRDVQSALLFGQERVVGVDVNPFFIRLHQKELRDVSGIAANDKVFLTADEARSYIARTHENFSIIQMSLIDTWAATGAGAFTLTENNLYTLEAWTLMLDHLKPGGIFTVARTFNPLVPHEIGRTLSLAVATLLKRGVTDYQRHIALLASDAACVVLVGRDPFTEEDIKTLREVADQMKYTYFVEPGKAPKNPFYREIVSVKSVDELKTIAVESPFNFEPTTDEKPYFFNNLRLEKILLPIRYPGITTGNVIATTTLLLLILTLAVLAVLTVVLPLFVWGRKHEGGKVLWSGAFYFCLIGAGFMCIEIGLIQFLAVFLGHPAYALGIILFTLILSAGCGSFASDRFPLSNNRKLFALPVVMCLCILAVRVLILFTIHQLAAASMLAKIFFSILILFPMGILMGYFFPTGMHLLKIMKQAQTPWYWGLNGIFGVLFSAMAVFFSIYFGISTNFYIAAILYALTLPCLVLIRRKKSGAADDMTQEPVLQENQENR